jgi:hypothetical protein
MKGNVTNTGYWPDSPDRNNDFNIIPSNNITMEGMDMPLLGVSNTGDKKLMVPGKNYKFKGESVMETPVDKGMFLGKFKQVGGQLVPHDISVPNLSRQNGGSLEEAAKRKNNEQSRIANMRNEVINIGMSHDPRYDNKGFNVKLPEGQPYCTTRACELEREAGFPVKQVASGYKLKKEMTPENGWYPTSYNDLLPGDLAQVTRNGGFGHTMVAAGNDENPNQKGFWWDAGSGNEFEYNSPQSEKQLKDWMSNVKQMDYYTYKGNLPQYEKDYHNALQNEMLNTGNETSGMPVQPIDMMPYKKHGGLVKRVKIKSLPNNWKSQ